MRGRTERVVTSRAVRPGEPIPEERDWLAFTPAERIEGVWTLTKACMGWNSESEDEPRLQRLLAEFNAAGVDYLVVGAHALAAHGHVRATKDLDIWIRPSRDNAPKVLQALASFGAPLHDLTENDLTQPGLIFQVGVPPVRIDLLTSIDGVDFSEAWAERLETTFAAERTAVLSRRHLIENKKATGRLQDLADLEQLESTTEERAVNPRPPVL